MNLKKLSKPSAQCASSEANIQLKIQTCPFITSTYCIKYRTTLNIHVLKINLCFIPYCKTNFVPKVQHYFTTMCKCMRSPRDLLPVYSVTFRAGQVWWILIGAEQTELTELVDKGWFEAASGLRQQCKAVLKSHQVRL